MNIGKQAMTRYFQQYNIPISISLGPIVGYDKRLPRIQDVKMIRVNYCPGIMLLPIGKLIYVTERHYIHTNAHPLDTTVC
jgi:hypothetical protein